MGKSTGRQPAHRAAIDPAPEASLALAVHVLGGMEFGRQVSFTKAWRWRRFGLMRCESGSSMPPCCAGSKCHPRTSVRRAGRVGLGCEGTPAHCTARLKSWQSVTASPHHRITASLSQPGARFANHPRQRSRHAASRRRNRAPREQRVRNGRVSPAASFVDRRGCGCGRCSAACPRAAVDGRWLRVVRGGAGPGRDPRAGRPSARRREPVRPPGRPRRTPPCAARRVIHESVALPHDKLGQDPRGGNAMRRRPTASPAMTRAAAGRAMRMRARLDRNVPVALSEAALRQRRAAVDRGISFDASPGPTAANPHVPA